MSADIKWNTAEFQAALLEYWTATGKDLAYVCNRQALNVAIKAYQQTPVADEAKIRSLPTHPWWPKFVAKTIMNRLSGGRVRVGKKRIRVGGKKAEARGSTYTIAQARNISRSLVTARLKRVGFIRSGWMPAIKMFKALKFSAKVSLSGGNRIHRPAGSAHAAVPGPNPVAIIINSAKAASVVGTKPLQRAFDLAAADMREYIRDKFMPTARSRGVKVL